MTPQMYEGLEVLRRIAERGLKLAHTKDIAFVDLFQHTLDELNRLTSCQECGHAKGGHNGGCSWQWNQRGIDGRSHHMLCANIIAGGLEKCDCLETCRMCKGEQYFPSHNDFVDCTNCNGRGYTRIQS